MYFSKGGILLRLAFKAEGSTIGVQRGGGSTIGFQMRSPLSKCIYLHCPVFKKKGGRVTIALYFTESEITFGFQSGRVHYWLSKGGGSTIGFQMRSPLSKCIYLHCTCYLHHHSEKRNKSLFSITVQES